MANTNQLTILLGLDNKNLKKGMKNSKSLVQSTMNTISSMKAQLAGLAVLAMPVKSVTAWAAAVNDLEDKTNLTGEAASKLLAIGQYVGLSTDVMANAAAKMSKNAVTAAVALETASRTGAESTDVFSRYGITILDNNNHLLSAEQILANVTEKHRAMANGVEKTSMEMDIFGKSGVQLNDMLNLTQDQLDNVTEAAEKSGLVLSHDQTQAWEDITFEMNLAKMEMQGIAISIGQTLLPDMKELSKELGKVAENVSNMSDEEKAFYGETIKLVGELSLLSLGIKGVQALSTPFISAFNLMGKALTAFSVKIGATKLAAAGLVGVVASVAALAAYKLQDDYSHYQEGGNFSINELGDVEQVGSNATPLFTTAQMEAAGVKVNKGSTADFRRLDEGSRSSKASTSTSSGAGTIDFDDSASKATTALDALKKKAETVSKNIRTEWVNTTKSNMEQLEIWKAAELAKLDETKSVNENYEDDKTKLLATYSKRRQDIITEEAQTFKDAKQELNEVLTTQTTPESPLENLVAEHEQAVAKIENKWRGLNDTFKTLNDEQKQQYKAYLDEKGVMYEESETNGLNFHKEILAEKQTSNEEYQQALNESNALNEELRYDIQKAFNSLSMEDLQTRLTDENAAKLAAQEEEQELMQAYYDWKMEAESTFTDFAINAGNEIKDSLSDAAAEALVYGGSFSEAMKTMTKSIAAMFVKWAVQRIAADALGKVIEQEENARLAASAAAATAVLTPPAILAETIHPGRALIAAGTINAITAASTLISGVDSVMGSGTSASGGGLSNLNNTSNNGITIPGYASGGIVNKATLAMVGEGQHSEAIIPLEKGLFNSLLDTDKIGGNNVNTVQNIYGDITTGTDEEDLFKNLNSMIQSGLRSV